MIYRYTLDKALADVEAIKTKAEVVNGYTINIVCLADAFALLERHDVRVQALLMSEENLAVLAEEDRGMLDGGDPDIGSTARLWSADIFCPPMSNDIVYCLARDDDDPSAAPRCSQISLDNLREL